MKQRTDDEDSCDAGRDLVAGVVVGVIAIGGANADGSVWVQSYIFNESFSCFSSSSALLFYGETRLVYIGGAYSLAPCYTFMQMDMYA
jgi:hypothetical protein